jgi:malonyl-CoA decarboxylase
MVLRISSFRFIPDRMDTTLGVKKMAGKRGKESDRLSEDVRKVMEGLRRIREESHQETTFQDMVDLYKGLNDPERETLFVAMNKDLGVTRGEIEPLLNALSNREEDDSEWYRLLTELRSRSRSTRLDLFEKISHVPGGLKFLLDLRGDLLSVRRRSEFDLNAVDSDIVSLFEMWFQEGFLYLEEITLDSSYRQIEVIKDRDMVHPMSSIEEMGKRLGKDRRCFALYHRMIPYEPVIFIEVALTEGFVRQISHIISAPPPENERSRVDTAIFYSINNTQNGLPGIGLGKILIARVVEYLEKEDDRIRNFATLSPLTGFWPHYLKPILEGKDENFHLKHREVWSFFPKRHAERLIQGDPDREDKNGALNRVLLRVLSQDEWVKDEPLKELLREPLVKIAYHYITKEKGRNDKPLNPVAGFHLGNGATVSERDVNFLANPSVRGLRDSCGIMANYVYTRNWLSQLKRSLRWFDRVEIRGLLRRPS